MTRHITLLGALALLAACSDIDVAREADAGISANDELATESPGAGAVLDDDTGGVTDRDPAPAEPGGEPEPIVGPTPPQEPEPPVEEPPVNEEPPVEPDPPVEEPPVNEEPPVEPDPVVEEPLLGLYDLCETDLSCESGACGLCDVSGDKRFCYEPGSRDIGDVCKIDDECASGACSSPGAGAPFGGVCASGSGKCICLTDGDCAPSQFCLPLVNTDEAACVEKKPTGALCKTHSWCSSNACDPTTNTCL